MKKLGLILLVVTFLGCSEDEGRSIWRVWYAVQVTPNYDIDITYNSDKFFATGQYDTINITQDTYEQQLDGFWIGQRLQKDKKDDYFINVKVNSSDAFTGKIGVYVYVNDTSLIDSVLYPYGTDEVTLMGTIPKNF